MRKIRKGTARGLKAVGGSFYGIELKVHLKNMELEQAGIMS